MRVRTPLGLFGTIVGVGLVPAFGIGGLIGVSMKDYDPIPSESSVVEGTGDRVTPQTYPTPNTTTGTSSRVEFVEPTGRTPNLVKPTTVKVYKTPHAEVNDVTPTPEESPDPVPTTTAPIYQAPENEPVPAPKGTEPIKPPATEGTPTAGSEDSDLRPAPKNS